MMGIAECARFLTFKYDAALGTLEHLTAAGALFLQRCHMPAADLVVHRAAVAGPIVPHIVPMIRMLRT